MGGHKAINEKYAFDPAIRSLTRAYGTPAKHPTPPLPPYRAQSPTPEPCEHEIPCHAEPCSWSMPLTKYRRPRRSPKSTRVILRQSLHSLVDLETGRRPPFPTIIS